MGKPTNSNPIRSNTNQAVQPQEMDIRLLHQEFNRLSSLLDENLAALKTGTIQPVADPNSQTKQLEVMQGIERVMGRVKRAFAEEKAGLKKFTSTMMSEIDRVSNEINKGLSDFRISNIEEKSESIRRLDSFQANLTISIGQVTANLETNLTDLTSTVKTEIDHLASEINKGLSDFRISHTEAEQKTIDKLDSFQTDLTKELLQTMNDVGTNLSSSVKLMSSDMASEIRQAVSAMEKFSENMEKVSDIKDSIADIVHNRIDHPFATSAQTNHVSEQIELFDGKLEKMEKILNLLFFRSFKTFQKDNVRLVGISGVSQTVVEGRLEVMHEGTWGTVCDDGFDMNDTNVACRMLGFSRGHSVKDKAFYGSGADPILLDNLACSGTESSLFDCRHPGIRKHNCNHDEDVGVECIY